MNALSIIISLVIVVLIGIIIIQSTDILKLNRLVFDYKKEKLLIQHKNIAIIKVTKAVLNIILKEEGILPIDTIPFVIITRAADNIATFETLESIRLKSKDNKVLVYLNGQIKPTKEEVIAYNITSFKQEHQNLVATLLYELKQLDNSIISTDLSPDDITNILNPNT